MLRDCKLLALATKHLQLTGHAEIFARNMIVQPDSDDEEDKMHMKRDP